MTTSSAAELAAISNARRLVLFHLSDRYTAADWNDMLSEARSIFPGTSFPDTWRIEEKAESFDRLLKEQPA